MYILKDLSGKSFARWTVLGPWKKRRHGMSNYTVWECKCECGTIKWVISAMLTNGGSRSCGCLQREIVAEASKSRRLPRDVIAQKSRFCGYRGSARDRNYPFEITQSQFGDLTSSACFYCGTEKSQVYFRKQRDASFYGNGIDRVDNSKGYIEGNVVPCCRKCNVMKRTMGAEEFISHCRSISNHHPLNRSGIDMSELVEPKSL